MRVTYPVVESVCHEKAEPPSSYGLRLADCSAFDRTRRPEGKQALTSCRRSERISERLEGWGPHGPSIPSRSVSVEGLMSLREQRVVDEILVSLEARYPTDKEEQPETEG